MKLNIAMIFVLLLTVLLVSCTVEDKKTNVVVDDKTNTDVASGDNDQQQNKEPVNTDAIATQDTITTKPADDATTIESSTEEPETTIITSAKKAHLKLVSTPSDADVYINGELVGKTPFDKDISIGYTKVEVKKYSYVDYLITFSPNENDSKNIAVKLTQDVGFIYTDSTPKRARVFLDGKYKGTAPVNFNTTFGEHTVKMLLDGYQNYTETVIVEPKKIVSVNPTLVAIN